MSSNRGRDPAEVIGVGVEWHLDKDFSLFRDIN